MYYYLLYDLEDKNLPYGILASDGTFSRWQSSLAKALVADFTPAISDVEAYLKAPDYPIIATYDQLPTIESHPELFL